MARPITLFTGQWADLPFEEVGPARRRVGLRRAGDRLLGRPLRRRWAAVEDDAYVAGPPRHPGEARAAGLRDLQPPHRPGGLRRPDRRAAPGHPAARASGATASPRACGSGRPRRCKDTARAAAELGVDTVIGFTGSSIWKTVAMFPPVPQSDDRRRLPRLRRPLEPDPRRLRRGRRAVRARGAPVGDRLRLLDDGADAGGDRPPRGVRAELGPEPLRLAGPRPGRASCGTSATGSTTWTARTRSARPATAATAGWARTCRGPTRAAAGTSSPPGTATCRGRPASGCSTPSATTAPSRSSGRTPAWTGWSARRRPWRSCAGWRSTRPRRRSTPRSAAAADRRSGRRYVRSGGKPGSRPRRGS